MFSSYVFFLLILCILPAGKLYRCICTMFLIPASFHVRLLLLPREVDCIRLIADVLQRNQPEAGIDADGMEGILPAAPFALPAVCDQVFRSLSAADRQGALFLCQPGEDQRPVGERGKTAISRQWNNVHLLAEADADGVLI